MSTPTAENPLLILAMDHRDSFAKLLGFEESSATPDQHARMARAKLLIYHGLAAARDQLTGAQAGVLVDEELGADVLRQARTDGAVLAMPVERSGQKLFALQYGEQTFDHIAEFDPAYVKVLVRMNPDDPAADTQAQLTALAELSADLHRAGRAFLYELLVPPTDEQRRRAGDQGTSTSGYDRDLRPELVAQVIAANQRAGVEPTLWKIEGLETTAAAEQVVAAARAGGRDTDCIVLGRDAAPEVLDHWLEVAAPVPGFVGFAIGRSIWEDALTDFERTRDEGAFVTAVTSRYLHFAHTYLDARTPAT